MIWFRVDLKGSQGAAADHRFIRAQDSQAASFLVGDEYPYKFEINPVDDEDVPTVQRGLLEATTEQLRAALRERGWKVKLS